MSMKEEVVTAALAPVMGMVKGMMKDIKPENVLAQWVQDDLPGLMSVDSDDTSMEVILKVFIDQANRDPVGVLRRLVAFHTAFGEFYRMQLIKGEDRNG